MESAQTAPLPLLMTAAQISERIMQVSARTLKRAQIRGDIRGKLIGGKWHFETASVIKWLSGGMISTPSASPPPKRSRGRPRKGRQEAAI